MRIGLIDVDGHNYPNLVLMKLSAYHKNKGDIVEWYNRFSGHFDKVYMSKVFSFTTDYNYYVDADVVIKGGSGYCISIDKNGKEFFDKTKDIKLPYEIEHIYPDYSLYPELTKDTAYGFLTRGCPRGCNFCIVEKKEGKCSIKVADLCEFWNGQKNIVLMDPNIIACKDWKDLLYQLIDSKAVIDINQGIDIRMMTKEKAEVIKHLKIKSVHFAWDRYEDKNIVVPKLKMFKDITGWNDSKLIVYMLTNFNTTFEQDLERVYTLRDLGYLPYVMIYEKYNLTPGNQLKKLQRWVNSKVAFRVCKRFEDYDETNRGKIKETLKLF